MSFSSGKIASIWSVEDKGKYSVAKITTSAKKKNGDGYEKDFQSNFVNLVGSAHEMAKTLQIGDRKPARIVIKSCAVRGGVAVEENGKKSYPYYFTIFEFEHPDQSGNQSNGQSNNKQGGAKKTEKSSYNNYPGDDGELPF